MNKYNSVLFGLATGIFTIILYILAVFKNELSQSNVAAYIKSFIPFYETGNLFLIIIGIFAAFLWGWVLGYFFMVLYNLFDYKFNS